jgi:hypothetical protein
MRILPEQSAILLAGTAASQAMARGDAKNTEMSLVINTRATAWLCRGVSRSFRSVL